MNTEATAKRLARELDKVRDRWPTPARLAEHPLTEALIRMDSRRQLCRVWVQRVFLVLLGWGLSALLPAILWALRPVFLAFPGFKGVPPFVLFIIIGWWMGWTRNILQRQGFIAARGLLETLAARDKARLMELWLTPLTYRDIAGIEVGRALYWHSRHAVPECILNLAVLSVAAGIFARFGWAPQHPLVRIVCYGGLLAGFIALNLETRSAVVKKVLHAVRRAVVGSAGDIQTKRRFDRWIGRGAASVSGALFVLLATCFLGFLIALCFSNTPSGDGPYILVGFGGFIVAAICAGAVWWDEMRFEVNVADDEWAKDGQKRYEDLVRELAEEHSSAAV